MALLMPQQDHTKCATWACCYGCQVGWLKDSFQVKMLKKENNKPIHAQMEQEEEGKITIKDIPNLTDMPKYKAHTSMSKDFRDFETYLTQHYRVEGSPLAMLYALR